MGRPFDGDSKVIGVCATHWILELSLKEGQECVNEVKNGDLLALQVLSLKRAHEIYFWVHE